MTASRLLTDANLRAEVETLRARIVEKLDLNAETLVRDVFEVRRLALLDGQHAVALKCCELLGKALASAGFRIGSSIAARARQRGRSSTSAHSPSS